MSASDYGVVSSTFPSHAEAARIGDVLLAERLAACVQFITVESRYAWKGEIKSESEVMLLAKTRASLFDPAITRIKSLHPYELPEIIAQALAGGHEPYLDWIATETGDISETVVHFWFDELTPEDWFGGGEKVDLAVKEHFSALYRDWSQSPPVPHTARQMLAQILVFDQFPRNLFRGTAQAFATDARALKISQNAIAHGLDVHLLAPAQRQFLYMPLMHAEDADAQAQSVAMFEKLGNAQALDFARAHQDVIARFGRFPGRNAALGRASTPEEKAFLQNEPQRF